MNKKLCFVIAPIGDETSDERKRVDSLLEHILTPLLGNEYEVLAAHKITKSGVITTQIVEKIYKADLIICDLTNTNGNVMYELAIAHLKEKQVIIIAKENKEARLPFDVSHQRVIFYQDNIAGTFKLTNDIKNALNNPKDEFAIDNPITSYLNLTKTSLVNATSVKDVAKDIALDAINNIRTSKSTKLLVIDELEKVFNLPKADQNISNNLAREKHFNKERFYNNVCDTIENNKFPVSIINFKKHFAYESKFNVLCY